MLKSNGAAELANVRCDLHFGMPGIWQIRQSARQTADNQILHFTNAPCPSVLSAVFGWTNNSKPWVDQPPETNRRGRLTEAISQELVVRSIFGRRRPGLSVAQQPCDLGETGRVIFEFFSRSSCS